MADTHTQNTPEIQQVTVDDLSRKIQETTNELNQLKNWLSNLSAEELKQRADELSDIEQTISECMDDLSSLEKDWSASISRSQLDALRSQINTLTISKDAVQAQIESQTRAKLDSLKWNIAQAQNNWESQEWDNQQWNAQEWENKSWLWRQWSWLWSKEEWKEHPGKNALRALSWVWIAAWVLKLWRRIFGEKYDYEKEIPWYKDMSRREKRAARKRLRKEKRAERKSEKSAEKWEFRQRPFGRFLKWTGIFLWVWSGVYYLAHWIYTKNWWLNDLFDWTKGKKLKMEEALPVVEWEVNNWKAEESMFRNDFDWIEYDEESKTIKSYWQETKVDVNKRMVEWLDVKFNDLPELIHAANIINCLKHNLWWKASVESPFSETSTWWDIQFKFSERWADEVLSWSNRTFWTRLFTILGIVWWGVWGGYIGWVVGAIWGCVWLWAWGYALWSSIDNDSTLGHACSTIKSWENFRRFIWYLNGVKRKNWASMWTPREQWEISDSPIKSIVAEAAEQLSDYESMDWSPDRCIDAKPDPQDPTRYEISSFTSKTYIKIEWWEIDKNGELNPDTIKSITIEKYSEYDRWPRKRDWNGIKLEFPHNKDWLIECIRTVDLINEIRSNYQHQWVETCSIYYRNTSMTERAWMLEKWLKIDTKWAWWKTIRSKKDLEKYYPTLLADLKKTEWKKSDTIRKMIEEGKPWDSSEFLCFINWMVDVNKENYFKEK